MYLPMIDTLIAILDIENYDESAQDLIPILEQKKTEAKFTLTENSSKIVSVELGEMTFEVLSNGKKGYAYILHNDLYEINLAQYRSKNEDFYPVYVKIKSECLWSMGPLNAWETIYTWIEKQIGKPIQNKISRIDLCCHADEILLVSEDADNFKGQFYTHNVYYFRRKVTGMNFGSSASGKIYCRIYDKYLEITQKKSKTWFFEIWKGKKLNTKKVWNVEFQICREYLKEHNITTVWQAFDTLGSLWEYCTGCWLQKIIPDNARAARCSIDPVWEKLQQAFKNFKHEPLVKRFIQLNKDADAMIPSAFGIFTTFAAKKGISNPILALNMFHANGSRYLQTKELDFQKAVKQKQALLDKAPKKPKPTEYIGEIENPFMTAND